MRVIQIMFPDLVVSFFLNYSTRSEMPFDRWDSDGGSGPFLLDLCNVENECSFAADLLVLLPLFGTI